MLIHITNMVISGQGVQFCNVQSSFSTTVVTVPAAIQMCLMSFLIKNYVADKKLWLTVCAMVLSLPCENTKQIFAKKYIISCTVFVKFIYTVFVCQLIYKWSCAHNKQTVMQLPKVKIKSKLHFQIEYCEDNEKVIEDENDADGGWVDTHHYESAGSPTIEDKVSFSILQNENPLYFKRSISPFVHQNFLSRI